MYQSVHYSERDSGVVGVIADTTILCLAIFGRAILAFDGQDEELHHVGLSVHVEDEDDDKYVFQLKLNHSKCCWTARSNVSLFFRKCIGT